MTVLSRKIAPPNSIVFVGDPSAAWEIPETLGDSLVSSTNSCIVIGCLSEMDGETQITLGNTKEICDGRPPTFLRRITTPGRTIVIETSTEDAILEMQVPNHETTVSIWVNDASEPDEVHIGIE